jgi:hypothetical protein
MKSLAPFKTKATKHKFLCRIPAFQSTSASNTVYALGSIYRQMASARRIGAGRSGISKHHYLLFSGNQIKNMNAKILPSNRQDFCIGAGSGGRTRMVSPPLDFESSTSANSIIPARISRI